MRRSLKHIKSRLVLVALLCVPLFCFADGVNYVRTITPRTASLNTPSGLDRQNNRISVTYYDELGREQSAVQWGASGNGDDLADYTAYDSRGRVYKKFISSEVSDDDSGSYLSDYNTIGSDVYSADPNPYTETLYDGTDLNRIAEQIGPGQAWRSIGGNHSAKKRYTFNLSSDTEVFTDGDIDFPVYCCLFTPGTNNTLTLDSTYADFTLRVVIAYDEDSLVTMTFTDKSGKKLLQRQVDTSSFGSEYLDTYFVYDFYGRLAWVLPPMASYLLKDDGIGTCDSDVLDLYAYHYTYDDLDRIVEKKLPGCPPIYYVYDRFNRAILSQDGEQRKTSEWSVTAYDDHHRVALEGRATTHAASTRESLQTVADSVVVSAIRNTATDIEFSLGYSLTGIPVLSFTPDRSYFYDDYSHWNSLYPLETASAVPATLQGGKGRLTGTAATDFNGYVAVVTAITYDDRGRETGRYERDLFGQDFSTSSIMTYNWTGEMTVKETVTSRLAEQTVLKGYKERYVYNYDDWGRLTRIRHKLGENGWTTLAQYTYDENGRVDYLLYHNLFGTQYTYNLRGWPTRQQGGYFNMTLA